MRTTTLASILFFGQVYGGLFGDMPLGKRDLTEDQMRRYVDSIIEPLEERDTPTSTVNITQWNESVLSACTTQLQSLNGDAGNPSGIAACYNIPFWDNSTGIFHADVRLFMISQPTGEFAGISAQNVQVDLAYASATAQSVDNAALRRRDDSISLMARGEMGKRQTPTLAQSYALYGKLDQDMLGMDMSTLKSALVPTVTLTGTSPQGTQASTTLSFTSSSFLVGSFSTSSSKSVTQANVASQQTPLQTLVVGPGQQFVLPGTHILITPVGAIVTGVWALLLAMTIGYGTVKRIQFKEQYRRRVAKVMQGRYDTI
ncbi:hypothetical protein OIDMADRAFT_165141 [Oidiodendron maius Zn]|uniref:Uncharacterized protein n=1 Tax=Oidiodendron maius (strain Zn) TaxID=913774 RepID=A0A0C3HBD8_OIDMZ|nr:hypothetical protein OIDMADRAFT_165141 [Oidiodendron maius Zn]